MKYAKSFIGLFISILFCTMSISHANDIGRDKILIIGNSIVYTNNLPAILSNLTDDKVSVDMFVKGGARLEDEAKDPRLEQALRDGHYSAVIIQEQGGLDLCSKFDSKSAACKASMPAHLSLATMSRKMRARVYYLGTYQTQPDMSHALVAAEKSIAKKMGAHYIEISDTLLNLSTLKPALQWYHSGDLHPGYALTTLMAVRIYREIYGKFPFAKSVCSEATLFGPKDKFDGLVKLTREAEKSTAQCTASSDEVSWMIDHSRAL